MKHKEACLVIMDFPRFLVSVVAAIALYLTLNGGLPLTSLLDIALRGSRSTRPGALSRYRGFVEWCLRVGKMSRS